MTKLKLTFLTLLISSVSIGQTKNLSEKEVLEGQRITTTKIIFALQNNNLESIFQYFDKNKNDIQSKLEMSASEIKKFKNSTEFSDVVVFDEDCHIFRCRFSDKTRARFQIDLYYQTENHNSKVVEIKIKTDQVLHKEHKKRMNNTKIPPAPPKPNGG